MRYSRQDGGMDERYRYSGGGIMRIGNMEKWPSGNVYK